MAERLASGITPLKASPFWMMRNPADEFLKRYIDQNEGVLRPDEIDPDTGLPKMEMGEQGPGMNIDPEKLKERE